MSRSPEDCGVVRVKMKFDYPVPPRAVWTTFTRDMAKWWPKDFFTDPRAKAMMFEARLGGRWYEDWGHGRGRVWHTVVTFDPPRVLETMGVLFPEFGGPATTTLRLEFQARGKGTRLRLTDSIFGTVTNKTRKSFEKGWEALLGEALGGYLKQKSRPAKRAVRRERPPAHEGNGVHVEAEEIVGALQ